MMNYSENQLACLEVIEVLKQLPDEQRNCIPNSVIENLQSKCGTQTITLKYDKSDSLIISQKAKEMLVYLYREYFVEKKSELKEKLDEKLRENEQIIENEKSQNENLKVKFDIPKAKIEISNKETNITEYKEKSIFKRIIKKFLKFFMS